jgi:hypothetical protein
MVEAVPPASFGILSVALEIQGAVVSRHVVLARNVKDAVGLESLQDLVRGIEFLRLGEL